jgi:hypothetical protein
VRADPSAITERSGTGQTETQPVVRVVPLVAQQDRWLVAVEDRQVGVTALSG